MKRREGTGPQKRKLIGEVPPVDDTTEAAIAAYLQAHPDFVERHPRVVHALIPPTVDRGDGVVDFQRYMVSRLQNDMDVLSLEKTALIHTARTNAQSQARIHCAVLSLIEARSLEHLIEIVTGDIALTLDVDVVALALEATPADLPRATASGIRVVKPGAVYGWLGKRDVVLHGGITGDEALYGPGAGLIESEALVRLPLSPATPEGILAFGSRNASLFEEGQGTELLGFLGAVTGRLIRAWLDLPPA